MQYDASREVPTRQSALNFVEQATGTRTRCITLSMHVGAAKLGSPFPRKCQLVPARSAVCTWCLPR